MVAENTLHFVGDLLLFAAATVPILTYLLSGYLVGEPVPGETERYVKSIDRLYVRSLVADFTLALLGLGVKGIIYLPIL